MVSVFLNGSTLTETKKRGGGGVGEERKTVDYHPSRHKWCNFLIGQHFLSKSVNH